MKRKLLSVAVGVFIVLSPVGESHAWSPKNHTGTGKSKVKELGKLQHTLIVRRVANQLLKTEFFAAAELPHKVAMATLTVEGDDAGLTGRELTNRVLNYLLQNLPILIVNHDLKLDESLDYKLMDYLSEIETRKQGIMLGAHHYLRGSLKTAHRLRGDGQLERHYSAKLEVREIRSNELAAEATYDYKRSHIKRQR